MAKKRHYDNGNSGAFVNDDMSAFSCLPTNVVMRSVGKPRYLASKKFFDDKYIGVEKQINGDLSDIAKIMKPHKY